MTRVVLKGAYLLILFSLVFPRGGMSLNSHEEALKKRYSDYMAVLGSLRGINEEQRGINAIRAFFDPKDNTNGFIKKWYDAWKTSKLLSYSIDRVSISNDGNSGSVSNTMSVEKADGSNITTSQTSTWKKVNGVWYRTTEASTQTSATSSNKSAQVANQGQGAEVKFRFGGQPSFVSHDPCKSGNEIRIDGDVPANIDLANEAVAVSLLEKGKSYVFSACHLSQERRSNIHVLNIIHIYVDLVQEQQGQKYVWVKGRFDEDASPAYKLSWYENTMKTKRDEEEAQRTNKERIERESKKAQELIGKEIITRTIEGFTLGMDKSQAIGVLEKAIKEGQFRKLGLFFELPTLSNDKMTIRNIEFPTEKTALFATQTSSAIQLFFYGSKLFRIATQPLADENVMESALRGKYGTPNQQAKTGLTAMAGTSAGNMWTDKSTILTLYNQSFTPYSYQMSNPIYSAKLSLIYEDRQIIQSLENQASNTQQRQQALEQQRRNTLPKNY